jgi:hypothetical protein
MPEKVLLNSDAEPQKGPCLLMNMLSLQGSQESDRERLGDYGRL